jgi:hypothetical protein
VVSQSSSAVRNGFAAMAIALLGFGCRKPQDESGPTVAKPSSLAPLLATSESLAVTTSVNSPSVAQTASAPNVGGAVTSAVTPAPTQAAALAEETMSTCPKLILDSRKGGGDAERFIIPTDLEQRTLEGAIKRALMHVPYSSLQAELGSIGYRASLIPEWPGTVLIHEAERKRGGGGFVVRMNPKAASVTAVAWAVQAPHTFYDSGTLPIACALFQKSEDARVLFYNTAHRYKSAKPLSDGSHPADVAHSDRTLFQAATRGLFAAVPKCGVVQVHGFSERDVGFGAVVSSGEQRSAPAFILRSKSELSRALSAPIAAYPNDSNELGATTNVQGALVRGAGGRFLHMELSDAVRQQLQREPQRIAEVADAVASVMRIP